MIAFFLGTSLGRSLIGVVAALALGLAIYKWGGRDADQYWIAKRNADIAEWHVKAEKAEAVQAMQAAADAQVQSEYESRIKELQNALKDADRICFDGDDADRVRDLWGAKTPKLSGEYQACFSSEAPVPPKGTLTQAKVFAIIAALKKSELAKNQCGQRLIAFYEGLAR